MNTADRDDAEAAAIEGVPQLLAAGYGIDMVRVVRGPAGIFVISDMTTDARPDARGTV